MANCASASYGSWAYVGSALNQPSAGASRSLREPTIVASADISGAFSSSAKAQGALTTSASNPASRRFGVHVLAFMVLAFMFTPPFSADLELDDVGMKIVGPIVLGPDHVLRVLDEFHEVDRLRPATQTRGQPVLARFFQLVRRNFVLGDAGAQRRDAALLHARERRMIEQRGRCASGSDERPLVAVQVDRQIHLPIGSFPIRRNELRLHADELVV